MKEQKINLMKRMDRYLGVPLLYVMKACTALFGRPAPPLPVKVEKIVLMKLWGIGNLVMIIPLVKAIRKAYPNATIYFVTLKGNEGLLKNLPELDHLITFHPEGVFKTVFQLLRAGLKLRKIRPDLVLDFEQFLRITPILAGFSGAVQTIGFKTHGQARSRLFNVKTPYRKDRHMTLAFGDIVRSAGINTHGAYPLDIPRSREAQAVVDRFFREKIPANKAVAALHLGSGDNFPGRRWPVERFARLAERLTEERGVCCVITGTEDELDLARQMEALCNADVINTTAQLPIMEFIEFLARVDLLVTNDTAPAHIGSALQVPLIAFYGPNTPDLYGPLHGASRVFYNKLPCSPCLTNLNAKTSSCRIPSCIMGIDPDQVFEAAQELLDAPYGSDASRSNEESI